MDDLRRTRPAVCSIAALSTDLYFRRRTGISRCGRREHLWVASRRNKRCVMANLSRYALVLALWVLWPVPLSLSGSDQHQNEPPSMPSFEADLLKIDDNRYVVKDNMGVERQVQIGKDTEIFGQARVGDRIQLWVQPNGYAQTIIIVRSGTP